MYSLESMENSLGLLCIAWSQWENLGVLYSLSYCENTVYSLESTVYSLESMENILDSSLLKTFWSYCV